MKVDHLLRWADGQPAAPRRVFWVLTGRCNLRCPICGFGTDDPPAASAELGRDDMLRVVDQLADLGVGEAYLVGGEVFVLGQRLRDVTAALKRRGIVGEMTTNGTLLTDEMCRHLVDIGWDRLGVSLDGPDAAGHDAGRGRSGVYEEAVAGIERLRLEKERQGAQLPLVKVVSILHRDNVERIEEFLERMVDVAASHVYFQPITQQSELARELMFAPEDLPHVRARLESAAARASELDLRTNAEELSRGELVEKAARLDRILANDAACLEPGFLRSGCLVPWDQLVIMWDGRVRPCWRHAPEGLQGVGEASVEAIWLGDAMERARGQMAAGEYPDACSGCCMSVAEENRSLRLAALHQLGDIDALVRLFCHIRDLSGEDRALLEPVLRTLLEQARDGFPADCWPDGPVTPALVSTDPEPLGQDVERALRAFGGLCEELSEHALAWGVALALPLDTTDAREVWRRASALEKTGQDARVLALLDGLDERDPTLAAAVLDTRGAILCRQGDPAGAAAAYEEALAREPLRVETTCALSYCHFLLGQGAEATALASRALGLAANPLASFLLDLYAGRVRACSAIAPPGPARLVRDADGTCISYSFLGDEHAAAFAAASRRT